MGLSIIVFFGLGIIMYYTIFKHPTFIHDIEIKASKPKDDTSEKH